MPAKKPKRSKTPSINKDFPKKKAAIEAMMEQGKTREEAEDLYNEYEGHPPRLRKRA